ncbi:MAG: hypothetical protein PUD71_07165 [Lachnospiraceae bacterium]|nr:hypothetical protein [Lachnospiraceae bacterium]
MNYLEQYLDINNQFSLIMKDSLTDENLRIHAKANCFMEDMLKLLETMDNYYEVEIYKEALEEYKNFLLFWSIGLYKYAYMTLRSYFELFLFGISLSINLLDYKLLNNGDRDLYWSEIVDEDNGLFSGKYVDAFCCELSEYRKQFLNMAKLCYRECSEYIHSNYNKFVGHKSIKFEQDEFDNIADKLETINKVICYQFFIRYWDTIQNENRQSVIEEIIIDNLGEIREIHMLFKGE